MQCSHIYGWNYFLYFNQQPSSNMDDSGFFSIQVSMKRSFVGLMVVVVGGGGVNIHLI